MKFALGIPLCVVLFLRSAACGCEPVLAAKAVIQSNFHKAVVVEAHLFVLIEPGHLLVAKLGDRTVPDEYELLKNTIEEMPDCWDVSRETVYQTPVLGGAGSLLFAPLLKIAATSLVEVKQGANAEQASDVSLAYLSSKNRVAEITPLANVHIKKTLAPGNEFVRTDLHAAPDGVITFAIQQGNVLTLFTLDPRDPQPEWRSNEYETGKFQEGFVISDVTPNGTTIVAANGQTNLVGPAGVEPVGRVQRDAKRPDRTFLVVDKRKAKPDVLRYTVTDDVVSYRSGTRAVRGDDAAIAGALKRSLQALKASEAK